MDKYRRGQKFVRENYASIVITKLLVIIHRISNWYNGEPWIKGTHAYKDLQVANKLHLMMRRKLCQMNNKQIDAISKIAEPWCPDLEILLKNFAMSFLFEKFGQPYYIMMSESSYRSKGINNMDLTALQAILIYIDAICHMWRCYGYFLGLEDKHSQFCTCSFHSISNRRIYRCHIDITWYNHTYFMILFQIFFSSVYSISQKYIKLNKTL
ncbi:hypothetical protein ACFW04_013715 [Cataglyphis niger]